MMELRRGDRKKQIAASWPTNNQGAPSEGANAAGGNKVTCSRRLAILSAKALPANCQQNRASRGKIAKRA